MQRLKYNFDIYRIFIPWAWAWWHLKVIENFVLSVIMRSCFRCVECVYRPLIVSTLKSCESVIHFLEPTSVCLDTGKRFYAIRKQFNQDIGLESCPNFSWSSFSFPFKWGMFLQNLMAHCFAPMSQKPIFLKYGWSFVEFISILFICQILIM